MTTSGIRDNACGEGPVALNIILATPIHRVSYRLHSSCEL